MTREELFSTWLLEERQPFVGWDFSHLRGRMSEDPLPWDYLARAAARMDRAHSVVDLDTGGGERFLLLRPHWPPKVVVTEGYPPNFELARERLSPLGVQVVSADSTDDGALPFDSGEFELVLNRHGAFNAAEVARVLAPGGTFLTQQVHGLWAWDLLAVFGVAPQWPKASPEQYLPRLRAAGMVMVNVKEWTGKLRFSDVGAIVYYPKAVPWEVPGFTVQMHRCELFALQDRVDAGEELAFHAGMYMIEARKPG